jgi:2'-5' RNA ligase
MSAKGMPGRGKSEKSKIRAFIAVKLPDHVIRKLAALQMDLKNYGLKIKWTRPENIHLTLKFLGDIHPDNVEPVCWAVDASVKGFTPISLCAAAVGFFPGIRRPRVLWTGISGQSDLLEKLHQAIDGGLGSLGFVKDDRRFAGHLTLGRFKGQPEPELLIDMMKSYKNMASDKFFVDAVSLFKSDLKPSGPVYTNLSSIQLGQ